jgi:hypothetical protein
MQLQALETGAFSGGLPVEKQGNNRADNNGDNSNDISDKKATISGYFTISRTRAVIVFHPTES